MSQSKTPKLIEDYYFHCDTCNETVDFWKYHDISDTDHQGHKTKSLTKQETIHAIQSCSEVDDENNSCLHEEFLSSEITFRQNQIEYISRLINQGIKERLSKIHQGDSITEDSFAVLICTKQDMEERLNEHGYQFCDESSATKAWDVTKHKMTDILMNDFWGAIDVLKDNNLQEFIEEIKEDK